MRTRTAAIRFIMGLPALVASATVSGASLELTGDIFALTSACCGGSSIDGFSHIMTSFVSDTAAGSAVGPGASGSGAITTAELDYGVFRGVASADIVTSDSSTFYVSSRIRGISRDSITIAPVNPALVGTMGVMNFSIQVTGTMTETSVIVNDLGTNARAAWSITLATELSNPVVQGGQVSSGSVFGDIPPQTDNLSLPVYLGLPTFFEMDFEVLAEVQHQTPYPGGTASAFADFGNTLAWLGIASVLDENGDPIEFSLTSGSGTDWTQPATVVPLPGSALLLVTGLLATLLRSIRRR